MTGVVIIFSASLLISNTEYNSVRAKAGIGQAKEDAVAVINYVLNAWGNGTITLKEVADIKIKKR